MDITMTSLSNNRGFALIVLIIAMTIIAVLATSMVSIVVNKNKSMVYSHDGLHASVIADSGAEFAIRYISEGLSDTSKAYFYDDLPNRAGSIDWKYYSPVYKTAGVTVPIGKFRITRTFRTSIGSDNILVESDYNSGMATRKVRLSSFRRFLSPITFYPDYGTRPTRQGAQIAVRVLGNHDSNLTVSKIEIVAPTSSVADIYVKYVSLYSNSIFDFSSADAQAAYSSRSCTTTPAPCLDSSKGLKLLKGSYTELEGVSPHTLYVNNTNSYYQFVFDSTPVIDQYIIRLTCSYGSSTWQPELKFTPQLGS